MNITHDLGALIWMDGHAGDTFHATLQQDSYVLRYRFLSWSSRFVFSVPVVRRWRSIYAYYDSPRSIAEEIDNLWAENCTVRLEDKLAGYVVLRRGLPHMADN